MIVQTIPEPAPEIRHVQSDRRIAYELRKHELSSIVYEQYSYIARFCEEGVAVDGFDARTEGSGDCAHPTWRHPSWASYLITSHDNGDVQFDVSMDRADLFEEYMATFVGTNIDGRLIWRRVEYLDLGSPRYLRAGLLEAIRFEDVEHKRTRVGWNANGEVRLTGEASFSRTGVVTFRDPETGLTLRQDDGKILFSEYQVAVSRFKGFEQVDLYRYDDPGAHQTYVIERNNCYRIVYLCRDGVGSSVASLGRRLLGHAGKDCCYLPVIYIHPREREVTGIPRGERATPLLPSRSEVYLWSRIAAMEDSSRPVGLEPVEIGGVYWTEKRLTLGELLVGEPGGGKSIAMKLRVRAHHERGDDGYVSMITDDKGDMRAFIDEELPSVRYANMNCLEADGHSFRIDRLLRDEPSVDTFCELIVEVNKEDPVWGEWAQELVKIVILYLIDHADPNEGWDLRDVCNGVRSGAFMHIAQQTREGRHFLKMHGFAEGTKQGLGVMAHASNSLQKLVPGANAMYQHRLAGREIDIEQFVDGDSDYQILLLGKSTRAEATMRSLNQVLFFFLAQLVSDSSRPEVQRLRFGAFIDELLDYTRVDLSGFANKARSKGAALFGNTQSLSELIENVKENHGSTWPLRAANKVFLKCDVNDAELAARLYGKAYRDAISRTGGESRTEGEGMSWGRQGSNKSVNVSIASNSGFSVGQELTDAVGAQVLLDLPSATPQNGVRGYALCDPGYGFGYQFHIPFSEWPARPCTSEVEMIDLSSLRTVYWGEDDVRRLGLPKEVLHLQRGQVKEEQQREPDRNLLLEPVEDEEIQELLEFGGYDQKKFFVPGRK